MTSKRIELLNLDRSITTNQILLGMEIPISSRHADVTPCFAAWLAIGSAWLRWQSKPEFAPISDVLVAAAERVSTAEARAAADTRGIRGTFDWTLLACAILSGDRQVARRIAGETKYAEPGRLGGGHLQAVAGILKARLLGDADREPQQLDLVGKRPDHPMPTPSIGLLRAFVQRDPLALDKEVTKGAKKHWTDRYLVGRASMPILVKDEPDHVAIDVTNKDSSTLWAYPEAVFAKVAMWDGAQITHNDLWFPLNLVSAARDSCESSVQV